MVGTEQENFWSPRLPEMVFAVPHGGRLYKVVPRPHNTKRQHVQNSLLAMGRYYLYTVFVNKFCTHYLGLN